jgi:hypothetical protein
MDILHRVAGLQLDHADLINKIMLTYNEIRDVLLSNPPSKVAIYDGNIEITIFGASTNPSDNYIWVAPYNGQQFKITEIHTLKILS